MSPDVKLSRIAAAGPTLILLYCFINAAKAVWEARLVQNISPEFLAFHCFLAAQLYYMAINVTSLRKIVGFAAAHKGDFLALNVSTAAAWLAVLYALKVLEPVVANAIIVSLIPICTLLLTRYLRQETKVLRSEILCSFGIFASVGYLIHTTLAGNSSFGRIEGQDIALGLIACLMVAMGVCGATILSRRFNDRGMTPSQLMASRFSLLIVLAGGLVLWRDSAAAYSMQTVTAFAVLGIGGVALAVYVLQVGISRTEPITVSLLLPTNLIMTYGLQFLDPRLDPSWASLLGVLSLSFFMTLGAWRRFRASRAAATG